MQPMQAVAALWAEAGLPAAALDDLALTGSDPVLPSSFAVGTAAQASIALSALAAAAIWRHRTGRRQGVGIDMRHAAAEFRSERASRVDGAPPPDAWDRIAGAYPCGDGRWVRLHTNTPRHRGRQLARSGLAGAHRAMDPQPGPSAGRLRLRRSDAGGHRRPPGRNPVGLRPPDGGSPCRAADRNAAALGPDGGAARHASRALGVGPAS
jgi:crotonobetainyl-CoA:carnitine CoA-transferase CaiB-like acyl-CoA transferase